MKEKLEQIRSLALKYMDDISNLKELDDLRIKFLGKKGELTKVLRDMGKLSPEERPVMGKLANNIRSEIEEEINSTKEQMQTKLKERKLKEEKIDITISSKSQNIGHRHPLLSTIKELEDL
ncbi:MAG TPA: phenylalanine--tRNA ligase subunit alpha, partial [Tissierellales bacterium]|nr:phenylalanine--tRNA ligase subunit alpha [Tissierellales bacterium]